MLPQSSSQAEASTSTVARLAQRHASYGRSTSIPLTSTPSGSRIGTPTEPDGPLALWAAASSTAATSRTDGVGWGYAGGSASKAINNIEPTPLPTPPTTAATVPPKPSPSSLLNPHRPLYPSYDVPPPQAELYNPYRRPRSPRRLPIPTPPVPAPPPLPFTSVPYRPPLPTANSFYSDTSAHSRMPTPTPDDSPDTPSSYPTVGGSRAGSKRKYKYTRTKTGCLCCRRRRVKCDEARPMCLKCVTAKRECEYAEGESPSRGNSTAGDSGEEGAEGPKTETSPIVALPPVPKPKRRRRTQTPIKTPPRESTDKDQEQYLTAPAFQPPMTDGSMQAAPPTSADNSITLFHDHPAVGIGTHHNEAAEEFAASNDMGQVSQAWGGAGAAPMLVSPDFLLPWFPTSEERSLILHYCANAADLMMAIPSGLNPMLAINLPLALDSPRGTNPASDALRIALLGVGAVHQAFLLARSGTSAGQTAGIFGYAASLRTSGKAMVRKAAADPVACRSDAALGAATSLALIDMLFGGSGWEDNFNLARGMIIARGGPAEMLKSSLPTPLADGVTVSSARLNLEVLAIYETMGCLTTGQEPLLLSDRWENWWFGSSRSTYEEHSVEKQFGMSRTMVHLFARLTRLLSRASSGLDVGVAMEAAKMGADVDAWIESLQVATLEHERVQVGNRAYAHTMKILLLRNVYMIPRTDLRVQSAAMEVLQHCSTSVALLGMSIDLTWPTIISASCIEGTARQWVLVLFEGFKAQCCFDIETAARIVLEVWARMDKGLPRDDWKAVCEDLGLRVLLC